MQFNMAKSKVMNLGSKNSRHAYQMSGQQLCITEEVDIGVALVGSQHNAGGQQTVLGQL